MPRVGGHELVQRLVAAHAATPVLFRSGYASDSERLSAFGSRRTQLLDKPFTATQLLEALEQLLSSTSPATAPDPIAPGPAT